MSSMTQVDHPENYLMIQPIDADQRQRIGDEVSRYLQQAETIYGRSFDDIEVRFDLKGKSAGMYRVKQNNRAGISLSTWLSSAQVSHSLERCLRFNPWIFAKYPEDSWVNTIPHEVAHYIVDCLYGYSSKSSRRVKPHGKEWQQVMRDFGVAPTVRASYDLSGIPTRAVKRFDYRCQCRVVSLSSVRHNKIESGLQRYRCRECLTDLAFIG